MFHRVIEGSIGCFVFMKLVEPYGITKAQNITFIATIIGLIFISVLYAYIVEPLINKCINKIMTLFN